jgi:hypothetical protein
MQMRKIGDKFAQKHLRRRAAKHFLVFVPCLTGKKK